MSYIMKNNKKIADFNNLQSQINDLKQNMDILHDVIYYGTCVIDCIRYGNIVTITCNNGDAKLIPDVENFRIPSMFTPYKTVDFPLRSPSFGAQIDPYGIFVPFCEYENVALRFSVSYIAKPL